MVAIVWLVGCAAAGNQAVGPDLVDAPLLEDAAPAVDLAFSGPRVATSAASATADFTLALASPTLDVVAGGTTSSLVTSTPVAGTAPRIALAVSGAPAGVTATVLVGAITAGGGTTLKIVTTTAAPAGTYPITVTGTAGTVVHAATLTLTVRANVTITAAPATLALAAGATATTTIAVAGGTEPIALSIGSLPYGVTATFGSTSIPANSSTPLVFAARLDATQGSKSIVVTGVGASGITRQVTIGLTVTGNSFGLAIAPAAITIPVGRTATATITTSILTGVAQPVTLVVSNLPPGVTASLSPSTVAAGKTSTLTLSVSPSAMTGTTKIAITGNAASGPAKMVQLAVTVAGDDFAVTASPVALTIANAHTATATIKTTLTAGAAQAIALTAEGLPTGVTATFAPASIQSGGSSVVTISVGTGVPPATWTLSLVATGAHAVHVAVLTLTIKP